jgi:hypothetical protein
MAENLAPGAFVPGLQLLSRTTVRRVRELPIPGEIFVEIGEEVCPSDVIGRALLPGDLHVVRVPEEAGVEVHDVIPALKIKVGEEVTAGTPLFESPGLFGFFPTIVRAPVDGTVEYIGERTGHIGVRLAPKVIEVDAYIPGKVVSIRPGSSIEIETSCAFLQGIFGVGGERKGRLRVLDVPLTKVLTVNDIPRDIPGSVLAGGAGATFEALRCAAGRGAVGLLTGSIKDEALREYLGFDIGIALTGSEKIPMTIIITEGFGELPFSARVHELLSQFQNSPISINGATQVRAGAIRPEVIVVHSEAVEGAKSPVQVGLSVGANVRLIRFPYFGKTGTISDLPVVPEKIETGAEVRVLRVKLSNGEVVTVPRANAEII